MMLTHTPNQVTEDHQLLDIAQDYFQFATNFCEVIEVSATHIYHSALELSPLSSIVRKFYYSQQPHLLPRVVIGTPDSWDSSKASISTGHSYYLSSTWSPCGQFVASVAEEAVEIRDALALKLLSTLWPTKPTTRFRRGLAYSPDGWSLASCSNTGIVIWDTQTGGEGTKIDCEVTGNGLELVWSLDGKTIGTLSPRVSGAFTVHTYDIASGAKLLSNTVQSAGSAHLWAHDESFQVMAMAGGRKGWTINIFEVGSTLTRIDPFSFRSHFAFGAFSPTTYQISVSTGNHNHDPGLLILEVQNSGVLLQETGYHSHHTFSPDGHSFAAFTKGCLIVWKYTSGHYTQWREFQQASATLQFSLTSSSILGYAGTFLHVLHLDYSPPALSMRSVTTTHGQPLDAFSPYGTYIATAHCQESTVMITNLCSQNPSPSQFIDTDLEISAMVLTGSVLLVKGSDRIIAWLLTEEGVVDGIFGNTRADCNDSLWEVSTQAFTTGWARLLGQGGSNDDNDGYLDFVVEDKIAAIRHSGHVLRAYHTGTGEILKSDEAPLHTGYHFHNPHQDECNLYHHNPHKYCEPLKYDWPVSQTTLQEGWVKDPEGKYRLWLYPHWRSARNSVDWLDKVTTLRLRNPSKLVIIKF